MVSQDVTHLTELEFVDLWEMNLLEGRGKLMYSLLDERDWRRKTSCDTVRLPGGSQLSCS